MTEFQTMVDKPMYAAKIWRETMEDTENKNEDGIEMAWGLIANAHGGNWDLATEEWRKAAERWRDIYWHGMIENMP